MLAGSASYKSRPNFSHSCSFSISRESREPAGARHRTQSPVATDSPGARKLLGKGARPPSCCSSHICSQHWSVHRQTQTSLGLCPRPCPASRGGLSLSTWGVFLWAVALCAISSKKILIKVQYKILDGNFVILFSCTDDISFAVILHAC